MTKAELIKLCQDTDSDIEKYWLEATRRHLEEAFKEREAWHKSTRVKPESLKVRVGPLPRID